MAFADLPEWQQTLLSDDYTSRKSWLIAAGQVTEETTAEQYYDDICGETEMMMQLEGVRKRRTNSIWDQQTPTAHTMGLHDIVFKAPLFEVLTNSEKIRRQCWEAMNAEARELVIDEEGWAE